jgi:hypothetical protein
MKLVSLIVFAALFAGFSFKDDSAFLLHRFIVQPSSSLTINGKTNVNSFQCGIKYYSGKDTLVLREGGRLQKPVFIKGSVALKASLFDCGMQVMTNDFCNTIKSNQYPEVVIDFKSFEKVPDYDAKKEKFKGTMAISLAGASKEFSLLCSIQPQSSGVIHLSGKRKFLFSDFNLEPPKKMMGMIKTEDELNVHFNLVLLLDGR